MPLRAPNLTDFSSVLAFFAMCNSQAALASSTDGQKRTTKSDHPTHLKLISLAPSNTELLCSLQDEADIEGVCSFCDFPAKIGQKAKVGTFVSANLERLSRIKPDLILLVSGQEMLAAQLKHSNFKTKILDNTHLDDIPTNLSILGALTGKAGEGQSLGKAFRQTMADLQDAVGVKATAAKEESAKSKRPTVFYCVWPQPLMTAGRDSFINEVITACGGTNIAGSVPAAYPRFSFEKLVLQNPDYIVLPYEARGQKFLQKEPWTKLKAVREEKVFFLEDQKHDMLSRPTLRIIKGAAWLSGVLHPRAQRPDSSMAAQRCISELRQKSRLISLRRLY